MSHSCKAGKEKFLDACIKGLRDAGSRVTKPRLAVIHALSDAEKPLSARELFELVSKSKTLAKIDQVTVYRILETFSSLGLIHQVFPSGSYMACFHQDCGNAMHILLRCSACEGITELDVPQETLAPMLWYLRGEHGFSPDEHLFQISGVCSSCS